jgi:transposase
MARNGKPKAPATVRTVSILIAAGRRVRARLHRWAFRQLQDFVVYKAAEHGIATVFVDPAYSSKTCHQCERLGRRTRHRFACDCGYQGHSDVNAALNHAQRGGQALSPDAGASPG